MSPSASYHLAYSCNKATEPAEIRPTSLGDFDRVLREVLTTEDLLNSGNKHPAEFRLNGIDLTLHMLRQTLMILGVQVAQGREAIFSSPEARTLSD
jgi:hypothetical protein